MLEYINTKRKLHHSFVSIPIYIQISHAKNEYSNPHHKSNKIFKDSPSNLHQLENSYKNLFLTKMIYIYNSSMEREIDDFPRWNIWKHWEERVQTQSRSKASGTAERRRSSSSSSSRCWRYTCPRARARVVRASKRRIPRRLLIPNNEPASSRVPGGGAARRLETWSSEERAREGRRGREGERGRARAASSPSNISRLTHGYDSIVRRRRRRDARASFVATALTRNSVCLAEFNRKSSRVSFPPILNFPRNVSINVFPFFFDVLFRVKKRSKKNLVVK